MFSFCVRFLVALAAMLSAAFEASADSISCQCQAAFVCDAKTCFHYDAEAPSCFTFKLTYDRPDRKIRLCRDAMCEEGKMSVEKTSDGQLILRTSLTWGGSSGGDGTWIMVDRNSDFVYRQKDGSGLEVISGPCE
jgi:hypothetical protein